MSHQEGLHRLLKLLCLIFPDGLKAGEKKTILKRDYDLVLTPMMEEELIKMGRLSLRLWLFLVGGMIFS